MNARYPLQILTFVTLIQLGHAQAMQYEIGLMVEQDFGIQGLNNQGDILYRATDGFHLERADGTTAVFGNAVNGAGPFVYAVATGVSDGGVCYGYAFTSTQGGGRRAAVWTEQSGWQVMPIGPFKSEGRGVTASGKVLCRGGDSPNGESLNSGWWQIGSSPVAIPGNTTAMACDPLGNAVFTNGGGSWILRADGTRQDLLWNGLATYATAISSNGLACGVKFAGSGMPNTQGIVWNTQGQIVSSVELLNFGVLNGVNSSGTTVGVTFNSDVSDTGIIYNPSFGLRSISSLLTPAYAGWRIVGATNINNSGQIVATAIAPGSSDMKYVLLNPVPEPATCATLGLGVVALLRRRCRSAT